MSLCFYIGTHQPSWLSSLPKEVALFISHRRLSKRKRLPRAITGYAVDSGGFTELSLAGQWRTTPREYVEAVARYDKEIGHMGWAAPQDWMCEPDVLARTGLTVQDHQRRTVANFVELSTLWPEYSDADCPFMPVLQGWSLNDYLDCWRMYEAAGVDLRWQAVVGLGSVCRRQNSAEIALIASELRQIDPGLPLHGFGVKISGLALYGHLLESADSMAWSFEARCRSPLPGCTTHRNCANCARYALRYRNRVLDILSAPKQPDLFYSEEDEALT